MDLKITPVGQNRLKLALSLLLHIFSKQNIPAETIRKTPKSDNAFTFSRAIFIIQNITSILTMIQGKWKM